MRRQDFAIELRAWLESQYIGRSRFMDMCSRYICRWMDGSADNAVDFGLTLIALLQGTSPEQSRFRKSFADDTASVELI